jgi:hypothetical protein
MLGRQLGISMNATMPLCFCLLISLSSICACFGSLLLIPLQMTNPKQRLQCPMQPFNARNAIVDSLSGSLSALAANVEEFHASLCVTHLTLEEDGFSSSASWVVAVALDTGQL